MIYVTGDTHKEEVQWRLNSKAFPEGKYLSKSDYVVVLGDFGLLWNDSKPELYLREWLNEKPWTTLFIDGNHENFDMIKALPTVEMFGSTVGKVNDSIYHLRRGEIYNIQGQKCFCLGGASSIDKSLRTPGATWWPEENISEADRIKSIANLAKNDFEVDYVFTHTCPAFLLHEFGINTNIDCNAVLLSILENKLESYKHWYFGHLHRDKTCWDAYEGPKYTALYNKVIKLGDYIETQDEPSEV